MLIGTKYKIESDNLNLTLYEDKGRWRAVGFYATVKDALKGMVDLGVNGTGLKDFEAVVKKQDELYALIEGLAVDRKLG